MSANLNSQIHVEDVLDPRSNSQRSSLPEGNASLNCGINVNELMNNETPPVIVEHCSQVYPVLLTAVLDPIIEQPNLVNTNGLIVNEQKPNVKKDVNIPEKQDEIVSVMDDKEGKQVVAPKCRRNPPRKAKSKQDILKKNHLMEKDLNQLRKVDQDSSAKKKDTKRTVNIIKAGSSKGKRPRNAKAKKIEPFDDITNDLPNTAVEKKRKRAPSTKVNKPIKKGAGKKRGRPAKKVPASNLINLVSTTSEMVEKFVRNNARKLEGGSNSGLTTLLRNQISLLSYVKGDYDRKKVTATVKDILKKK